MQGARHTVKGRNVPRSPRLPLISPELSECHGWIMRLYASCRISAQGPAELATDASVPGVTRSMTTVTSSRQADTSVTAMEKNQQI